MDISERVWVTVESTALYLEGFQPLIMFYNTSPHRVVVGTIKG
jgi:hypothetical protein